MTHPAPTPIDDPVELTIRVEGYLIELGVLGGVPMSLPPNIARWVGQDLLMHAADVDRKAAKAMCSNAAEVMKR